MPFTDSRHEAARKRCCVSQLLVGSVVLTARSFILYPELSTAFSQASPGCLSAVLSWVLRSLKGTAPQA